MLGNYGSENPFNNHSVLATDQELCQSLGIKDGYDTSFFLSPNKKEMEKKKKKMQKYK